MTFLNTEHAALLLHSRALLPVNKSWNQYTAMPSSECGWEVKSKVILQTTAWYLSYKQHKNHHLMTNIIRSIKHSTTVPRKWGVDEDKVSSPS